MLGDVSHRVDSVIEDQIESYLETVLDGLRIRSTFDGSTVAPDLSRAIFDVLASRRYGHLGRRRSEAYWDDALAKLAPHVSRNVPVHFYYDLGSGYHASLEPGVDPLSFDVGLGELLALQNVVSFCNDVQRLYEPGARFHLVIDNLCGWATNDVPLDRLEAFVADLRLLIRGVGADDMVQVLTESENTDPAEYLARLSEVPEAPVIAMPADSQVENVSRFLGRRCSRGEAAERIERYRRTTIATEDLLAKSIHGVRLTQRAGPSTLGFRAFAGGDQRIQAGRVVFTSRRRGGVKPALLTSRGAGHTRLIEAYQFDILPLPISTVAYVEFENL